MTIPQPRSPILDITIGGRNITKDLGVVESFEYTDTVKATGDKFTLTLFDSTWTLLDSSLLRDALESGGVKFTFGWVGQPLPPLRGGRIMTIEPGEISLSGIRYVLQGLDDISSENVGAQAKVFKVDRVSDLVKEIAEENNWKLEIVETDKIPIAKEGKDTSNKFARPSGMTDLSFLTFLASRAKSSKKTGRYITYVDYDRNGKQVLHFHPSTAPESEVSRTYTIIHDSMGEVISFSPVINTAVYTHSGIQNLEVGFRDPNTLSSKVVATKPTDFKGEVADEGRVLPPDGKPIQKFIPSVETTEAETKLASTYSRLSSSVLTASMQVMGDPHLKAGKRIKVIVKTPKGRDYFTSGIYRIEEIQHSVSSGTFTSTMKLQRNSAKTAPTKHNQPKGSV